MVNVTQRDLRSAGFYHRINVTAPDVLLIDPATALTLTTVTTGGHITPDLYTVAYVAGIETMGVTNRSNLTDITVPVGTSTNLVSLAVPQLVGATHYELFFSTDANPLWIGVITETQRAAGALIGTYGVATSPSALAAPGEVTFDCIGTGMSIADPIFDWSNAFIIPIPDAVINCVGKSRADIYVQFEVDDLREKPYFIAVPFYKTQNTDNKFYCGPAIPVASPEMVGGSTTRQLGTFDISACTELIVTIGGISGHGAFANLWVELV